mmetsp:Transcript_14916/g.22355  ORF Transcript_14916/g.22355 Transcript_14916/m.22355 type:complete len:510 (-) Transcript_14916:61-1590(-)|eukprot:CAMPEP_0194073614 /NCGR_PEP_ID=MMETSP0149-20130528/968_1 /TAXON_ID=122233 /ORGANISM="Chaetoceros debilis, Strain MM31A-1" /LENGTH=509 /DNA_ID=CAMNT_0038753647 /DNA_START=233 /DNA_END=1762 /DNA_ORIENTATION=-
MPAELRQHCETTSSLSASVKRSTADKGGGTTNMTITPEKPQNVFVASVTDDRNLSISTALYQSFTSPISDTVGKSENNTNRKLKQNSCLEKVPTSSTESGLGDDKKPSSCVSSDHISTILYLSVFAIIGSSLRSYFGRIFGLDCEFPLSEADYLAPLSSCITATGLTEQRGGALFIDLPTNMIGSFLMGLLTPADKNAPVISWLKADHHLQKNETVHLSLRTGLCGSLTTFASWNTQMIVMISGRQGVLGPQVAPAIFGYILGVVCAVGSFKFGRHLGKVLYSWRDIPSSSIVIDKDEESAGDCQTVDTNSNSMIQSTNGRKNKRYSAPGKRKGVKRPICDIVDVIVHGKFSPIIFVAMLFTLFFIGDLRMNSSFHKDMWVIAIFAPFGTVLRWKMALMNGKWCKDSEFLKYFPFGTLFANVLACIISATAVAFSSRLDSDGSAVIATVILTGLKSGFAGNLSTVSSFAKEIVLLSEKRNLGPAYFYTVISVLSSCLFSLSFYLPISAS